MCGICGFLIPGTVPDIRSLAAMTNAIRRRGPDAEGLWHEDNTGIAMGHRRLSVLDLSAAGAQPMCSDCDRYMMVFNGEIYNHLDLRVGLEAIGAAPDWGGHSDTETMLAAITHWGLAETLRQARGMFAVALWDKETCRLFLARDRIGEKPLYFTRLPNGWAFGSDLKALWPAPGFQPKLSSKAIHAYLEFGYVSDKHCICDGVSKVQPGHIVTLDGDSIPESISYETFLTLAEAGRSRRDVNVGADEDTMLREVEDSLSHATSQQCLSDVPLGAFLSGGIDSSLITSLMQAQSSRQVQSFSIGFDEARFNEAPHAAKIARHLGTAHTEFILSQADALQQVYALAEIYDEPFADSSQIPTVLLCREARKTVTVALTGDGGDEIFGGYNRHIMGPGLWCFVEKLPYWTRRIGAGVVGAVEPLLVSEDSRARGLARRLGLPITAIDKLGRLAPGVAQARDFDDFYRIFVTTFSDPNQVLSKHSDDKEPGPDLSLLTGALTTAERMMAWDTLSYLPGDILVKVDRGAMYSSLETRAPFLDARVIETAWALPPKMKIREGQGKYVLRKLLDRHVPRELIDRPKQGFSIPLDSWLRGDLRSWAAELLRREDLYELAGLNLTAIERLWHSHQRGRANHGQKLWTVLMLLSWLKSHAADFLPAESTVACSFIMKSE